jgi:hypothetical protein
MADTNADGVYAIGKSGGMWGVADSGDLTNEYNPVQSNYSNTFKNKPAIMVPLDEEHASGAPVGVRDGNGEPTTAATKRVLGRGKQNPAGTSAHSAPFDRRTTIYAG